MISNENSVSKMIDFLESSNSKNIVISHLIHRDIGGCHEICGGCCKKVSLDYLDKSERWEKFKRLYPEKINDYRETKIENATFYSNPQSENKSDYCQYLDLRSGLCTIHEARPLLCQSTPLKFKNNPTRNRVLLTSETYGRKHAFKRVDGLRGAKCKMLPVTEKRLIEDIQFLEELKEIGIKLDIPVENLNFIISLLKSREKDSKSITLKFE